MFGPGGKQRRAATEPNPPITYLREMQTRHCRTRTLTGPLFREFLDHVSFSKIKGRECLSVIPVYCSGSNKAKCKGENNLNRPKCEN